MCPIYTWVCEECGTENPVLRKFDDYKIPPEECEKEGCKSVKFRRAIGRDITVTKGWNWGEGKGNWMVKYEEIE